MSSRALWNELRGEPRARRRCVLVRQFSNQKEERKEKGKRIEERRKKRRKRERMKDTKRRERIETRVLGKSTQRCEKHGISITRRWKDNERVKTKSAQKREEDRGKLRGGRKSRKFLQLAITFDRYFSGIYIEIGLLHRRSDEAYRVAWLRRCASEFPRRMRGRLTGNFLIHPPLF